MTEVEVGQKWTSEAGLTVTVIEVGTARECYEKSMACGGGRTDANLPSYDGRFTDTDRWVLTEWRILTGGDHIGENRIRLDDFLRIYKKLNMAQSPP